jgi:putative hemolysin
MFSVEQVIEKRFPGFTHRSPRLGKTLLSVLRFICREREFRQFKETYPHAEGFDFVYQVLKYFDFGYRTRANEREHIPSSGRVVIIANHPIGSLDGLALLDMVGEIRPDVKAVANEMLYSLEPLRSLLLPVDNMTGRTRKEQLKAIHRHLDQDGAIIIFPAGEVSRVGPKGIKDGHWHSGFLRFAKQNHAPVLPVFIDGRNSIFFYGLSLIVKPISTLWLIREMFKHARNEVDIHIGHLIYPEQFNALELNPAAITRVFKKQVYALPKKNKTRLGFVAEYDAVAHPEDKQLLRREVKSCQKLGATPDGKEIYQYQYTTNSVIMRELGRLRELTFRAVKEGTGRRRDTDLYDHYYDHVILWDDQDLEIVGSYRMVRAKEALRTQTNAQPLYTQTLFDYAEQFSPYFDQGLELGRSFIQPRYWGKRSLDYLWLGVGAYLRKHPDIRYLFGPVTISADYSSDAKALLVAFYTHYFGRDGLARAKNSYLYEPEQEVNCFNGDHYQEDFCRLKAMLKALSETVPTLYKQYAELCHPEGVNFLAFNIDAEFADCVDGLILVDISKMKPEKNARYLQTSSIKRAPVYGHTTH